MRTIFILLLNLSFLCCFSQSSFTLQEDNLNMSGSPTDNDFSSNTYANPTSNLDVNVVWEIIESNVPDEWELSFCFPLCFVPGVTNASTTISNDTYLNCHVYPNGKSGIGVIKMHITDNNGTNDTITWNATATTISILEKERNNSFFVYPNPFSEQAFIEYLGDNSYLVTIYDSKGKEVQQIKGNGATTTINRNSLAPGVYFVYLEDNGAVLGREKIIITN